MSFPLARCTRKITHPNCVEHFDACFLGSARLCTAKRCLGGATVPGLVADCGVWNLNGSNWLDATFDGVRLGAPVDPSSRPAVHTHPPWCVRGGPFVQLLPFPFGWLAGCSAPRPPVRAPSCHTIILIHPWFVRQAPGFPLMVGQGNGFHPSPPRSISFWSQIGIGNKVPDCRRWCNWPPHSFAHPPHQIPSPWLIDSIPFSLPFRFQSYRAFSCMIVTERTGK